MSILETIVSEKRRELQRSQRRLPLPALRERLEQSPPTPPRGFARALRTGEGPRIIAEVKRASPSKGVLRPHDPPGTWRPEALAARYESGGAAALSVLTDVHHFWGHPDALPACRDATDLPVLRKDFLVDVYQVDESRWLGADAVLLIARALERDVLQQLAARSFDLGMDVLLEVHDEAELDAALSVPGAMVGINNRDLSTLTVDIGRAARMRRRIPDDRLVVAESGLSEPEQLTQLIQSGIEAFLIGEHLVCQDDPAAELRRLRCR